MISANASDSYTEKLYGYEKVGENNYCPGKEETNNLPQLTASGWKINSLSRDSITDDSQVTRLINSYTIGLKIADVICQYFTVNGATELQRIYQEKESPYPLATDIGGSNDDGAPFSPTAKRCVTTAANINSCGWTYFHRHLRTEFLSW